MSESPNARASSAPDLSDLSMDDTAEEFRMNVNRRTRKRGHNDEFTHAFEDFTKKIMTTLNEWKMDFGQDISQINNTLKNLSESTQEMKAEVTSIRNEFSELKKTVRRLESRQTEVEGDITSLKKSMQHHSDEHDDVAKKLEIQNKEIKVLYQLKKELEEVKVQNRKIRTDINASQQRDRLLNIEIVGIPERDNENLNEIILKIGKSTEIDIRNDDVLQVNRVTAKLKVQGRPRNIVAKLRTRQLKDNVISQARKRRLSTKDLDIQGSIIPVYINEHLTLYNKNLLKMAKEIANLKEYQYIWTKNCRIHVRKAVTIPAIFISDEEDLRKII
ncbi:protein NETWORKED 1B-like [Spodoptera litura]|uniref:Protein NETWORKED 1B-like n=1 Tax=Spodoptera litura TaxID=69820 RepID=A0A9J7E907_SPOLT|nr:protein NETWORKED 1B-like [Spodoptera litura]